jgi:hypothetical protein
MTGSVVMAISSEEESSESLGPFFFGTSVFYDLFYKKLGFD